MDAFRTALKNPASEEQRQRLEKLIAQFQDTVDAKTHLRTIRALEVLERIGTPEAKKIVEMLAGGHAGALPTREARGVLTRWH